HRQVGQDEVGPAGLNRAQAFDPVVRCERRVSDRAELFRQRVANGWIVVDDQNDAGDGQAFSSTGRRAAGKSILAIVPPPGRGARPIMPPLAAARLRAISSPRPRCATSLVSVAMLPSASATPGGRPGPRSSTSRRSLFGSSGCLRATSSIGAP